MLSFRSTLAVLLLAATPMALAGCGSSEEQDAAKRANDVINTTATEAEKAKTAAQEKAIEQANKKQAKDLEGIAGDVKNQIDDNVKSTVEGAQTQAQKKAAEAEAAAKAAADEAITQAQREAGKVQSDAASALDDVEKSLQDAQNDIQDAAGK